MNFNDLKIDMSYIIAVLVVLGLLILVAILIRTLGSRSASRRGGRLGLSETYDIDKSRQLVLLRRDDVEHLILIGGPQDLVIETNISEERASTIRQRNDDYDQRLTAPKRSNAEPVISEDQRHREPVLKSVRPAPRPPVFGDDAPNIRPIKRGSEEDGF